MHLQIIITSTRPGRQGDKVAAWFEQQARRHGQFTVELVDLAQVGLPVYDEPHHPRLRQYQHEHTKRWSEIIERGDAYVFVLPEYNFSAPPSFVNAVDFLFQEWAYKPAAFVSYGGASGGLRAVQSAKPLLTSVRTMPIPEAVAIPFFSKFVDKETGAFTPEEGLMKSADGLLNELLKWATALQTLRAK